jgi:ketosteroid isomerase-like protein
MNHDGTMPGVDTPIGVIVEERIAALRDKDPDRLAAVYDPQIVMFSLAPPLQDTGPRIADPAYWRPWLDGWAGPITLEVTELDIAMSGDVAFCHSLNRMRGIKTDGGHQDLWFRATLGLRKTGADWKITHEHNSTPFYMDGSGRAATDLQPEAGSA